MLIITRLINQLTVRGSLITVHGELGTGGAAIFIPRQHSWPVMMLL